MHKTHIFDQNNNEEFFFTDLPYFFRLLQKTIFFLGLMMICPILNVFGIVLNTATYPYRDADTACEQVSSSLMSYVGSFPIMIILKLINLFQYIQAKFTKYVNVLLAGFLNRMSPSGIFQQYSAYKYIFKGVCINGKIQYPQYQNIKQLKFNGNTNNL